ncbi:MAG: hypothetical protein E7013_05045 [Alphaproteobacteria bacterium]|nr:hypothetical protein [Alphaproteobacteria bacterium]
MRKTKKIFRLKNAWLLTLLDLMLLVLTFFIMLYSMRTSDISQPTQFGTQKQPISTIKRGVNLNYLEQILSQQVQFFDGYKIKKEADHIQIQIPEIVFSNIQKRTITALNEARLQNLGQTLAHVSNKIRLEVNSKKINSQDALLLGMSIANQLKDGGCLSNFRIVSYDDLENPFIQLLIFEQEEKK